MAIEFYACDSADSSVSVTGEIQCVAWEAHSLDSLKNLLGVSPLSAEDFTALGSMVVAVFIAAFAVKSVVRVFKEGQS